MLMMSVSYDPRVKRNSNALLSFLKSHKEILFILGIWFILRCIRLTQNFQFDHGDFMGDYLTSHHILAYGEHQYVGQSNSVFTTIPNSSFYNYFLAIILSLHDSVWTLVYLNIILQLISFVSLYALAYLLFGRSVALLTGLFLAINQVSHNQIHYLWLPTAALPFFNLSYFFYALSYIKKHISYLYISIFFFIIASGIGLYGFALLPCLLIGLYLNLKHTGAKLFHFFVAPGITIAFITLLYAPVIYYVYATNQVTFLLNPQPYINSLAMFFTQYIENARLVLTEVFVSTAPKAILIIASILSVIQIYMYIRHNRNSTHKLYASAMVLVVCFVVAVASLLTSHPSYHFVMITGPIIVLFCELALFRWSKKKHMVIYTGVLIAMLLLSSVIQPSYAQYVLNKPSIYKQMDEAVRAIIPTLREVENTYGHTWPEHFKLIPYSNNPFNNPAEGIFWVMLEEQTQTKLTKSEIHGEVGHNYKPLGIHPDYLIVICSPHEPISHSQQLCAARLKKDYPQHRIVQTIYDGGVYQIYNIFLALPMLSERLK